MMNKTILALAAVASASAIVPLMAQASYAYVGTYNPNGEGVYRFIVNAQGELSGKTLVSQLPNQAQMVASADGKHLYVASETEKGSITAYQIGTDGSLTALNQVDT